jgi:hypothetical protein
VLVDDDPHALIEIITSHARPDAWRNSGGPGEAALVFNNVLGVSQSWLTHRQLRRFLGQWQASMGAGADALPRFAISPNEQRLQQAMARLVTFSCTDRPAMAAVAELANRGGVENVVWNWRGIEHASDAGVHEILKSGELKLSFRAAGEPLGEALTRLLHTCGLSWTIRADALQITSDAWSLDFVTAFYPLPSELTAAAKSGALLEVIKSHVKPDSWRDGGGIGTIHVSDALLVLSQTWPMHAEIKRFLDQCGAFLNEHSGKPAFLASAAERAVLTALERPISYAAQEVRLRKVLTDLATSAGIRLTTS